MRSVIAKLTVLLAALPSCVAAEGSEASAEVAADERGAEAVSAPLPVSAILRATEPVNLRSGPSTSYAIHRVVPRGQTVVVVASQPKNGFYQVRHDGLVGWSHGAYYELYGEPDPTWSCASSDYRGKQYWTCAGSAIHRCDASGARVVKCPSGCKLGPLATDDTCNTTTSTPAPPAVKIPTFSVVIHGGLFSESAVRGRIEEGLRYEMERLAKLVPIGGKTVPHITIHYRPASTSYCSGTAYSASTDIYCPYGYPIAGDNQNYVVNITLHELGHILAQHLIAHPSARDHCVNEGLASWIAGKYWANANSAPVDSLRTAARASIDAGRAWASMDACHLASDAWYKVYASYFEYLERHHPSAIAAVSNGTTAKSTYVAGWKSWLGR